MTRTRSGNAVRFSTDMERMSCSGKRAESVPPAAMSKSATQLVIRYVYCWACHRATARHLVSAVIKPVGSSTLTSRFRRRTGNAIN